QQQGRMEGQQHARSQSHHMRVLAETCGPPSLPHRVSHSPACVFVRARGTTRAVAVKPNRVVRLLSLR
ncbi:hypothetical protein KUCAC02_003780, partial [Chaenocephalus aceratus]